jgi:hypothetical protein
MARSSDLDNLRGMLRGFFFVRRFPSLESSGDSHEELGIQQVKAEIQDAMHQIAIHQIAKHQEANA